MLIANDKCDSLPRERNWDTYLEAKSLFEIEVTFENLICIVSKSFTQRRTLFRNCYKEPFITAEDKDVF